MAEYRDVRGHLDCDYEDLNLIREVVATFRARGPEFALSEERVRHYSAGWLYQHHAVNWVAHAFFGATVRQDGVELIRGQLTEIARQLPHVTGLFLVDDTDRGPWDHWVVAHGRIRALGPCTAMRAEP